VAGTVTVSVPPYEVTTPETVVDGATETVVVPPEKVLTVTDETDSIEAGETYELMATGTVKVEPDGVEMTSVMYGVDEAGVWMVSVDPLEVVTETVFGVGMWRVAEPPFDVLMSMVCPQSGTVSVVVEPDGVTIDETTGDEAVGTQIVESDESMTPMVETVDGTDDETDETNDETSTEVTV